MVVGLLMVMALALFDLGRGIYTYLAIVQGARDGARVAMESSSTDADVRSAALAAAAPVAPSVVITRSSTVTVTLTYDYQPMTPFFALVGGSSTLRMTSAMVSQ